LKKLVQEGKIKEIGLSEASPEVIRECHNIHPVASIEQEYSLGLRHIEIDLLPVCRELGVKIVAYSPLARGIFSDSINSHTDYKDYRSIGTGYLSADNFEHNIAIVKQVRAIAEKEDVHVSTLALAWLLRQGDDIIPIPGTTKWENFLTNHAAVE